MENIQKTFLRDIDLFYFTSFFDSFNFLAHYVLVVNQFSRNFF